MQPLSDDMSLFPLLTAAVSSSWQVHRNKHLICFGGMVWDHIMHAEWVRGNVADSVMRVVGTLIKTIYLSILKI